MFTEVFIYLPNVDLIRTHTHKMFCYVSYALGNFIAKL